MAQGGKNPYLNYFFPKVLLLFSYPFNANNRCFHASSLNLHQIVRGIIPGSMYSICTRFIVF